MKSISVDLDDRTKPEEMAKILKSLGIKCESIEISETKYFDKYDIRLSPGTRIGKIERSLPDIGLALKAQSSPRGFAVMRDGVYRIEVQKCELSSLTFSELYQRRTKLYAPTLLGVSASGGTFIKDLHELPNLLIGGIPGSGKSVLLHSIIMSLISCNSKLYLVDPKMVEFNIYEGIRQVRKIGNTVEDVYEIIGTVDEIMQNRFEKLSSHKCRNIHEYNEKARSGRKMKPVVIIVDEWADIVLQNKAIQKPLCVIAQKGRAAGISVVLATQRPSSDVISGLIKANFSGRIALRVATKLESRIILDQSGAETINDIGTGLYLDHKSSEPILFRAPWIEKPDIELSKLVFNSEEIRKSFWQRLFEWDL